MRISYWSSDVCSSDLADNYGFRRHILIEPTSNFSALLSGTFIHSGGVGSQPELRTPFPGSTTGQNLAGPPIPGTNKDRKSVVSGKSGSVRVDPGGRRILKKKKTQQHKSKQ